MITITENQLTITIRDSEPLQRRDWLIKAIAATMRWMASDPDQHQADRDNQYVLAQLLEELACIENNNYLNDLNLNPQQ